MIKTQPLKFDTHDYAIGGKMVVGKTVISETHKLMIEEGNIDVIRAIKRELIGQMADFMIEQKLVEFTYYDDPLSFSRSIAVRAYLAPNDQIKILRVHSR